MLEHNINPLPHSDRGVHEASERKPTDDGLRSRQQLEVNYLPVQDKARVLQPILRIQRSESGGALVYNQAEGLRESREDIHLDQVEEERAARREIREGSGGLPVMMW